MGENFQDHSWIQDFEAGSLWKFTLKILNYGDHIIFSGLFLVCLRIIDHLNLKVWYLVSILQNSRLEYQKFRILWNLNFHQHLYVSYWRHYLLHINKTAVPMFQWKIKHVCLGDKCGVTLYDRLICCVFDGQMHMKNSMARNCFDQGFRCELFIDCVGTHTYDQQMTWLLCQSDAIMLCFISAYSGTFDSLFPF